MRVEEVWRRQRQWSAVAIRVGQEINRWRSRNLGLILAGSALGALAAQGEWFAQSVTVALGAASAGALALAAFVQSRVLTAEKARIRVETRSGSETLMGIVYQYLAGVAPFDDLDRDRQLGLKVTALEALVPDTAPLVVGEKPDERPLPQIDGVADYLAQRAQPQREWHLQRSVQQRGLAARWRAGELVATAVAAVLAAVGGALHGPDLSAWVAVATTAGAAIAAHRAGQQHDRLADSYARTVLALDAVLRDFDPADAPTEASLVVAVERILAAQNDSWASLFSTRPGS